MGPGPSEAICNVLESGGLFFTCTQPLLVQPSFISCMTEWRRHSSWKNDIFIGSAPCNCQTDWFPLFSKSRLSRHAEKVASRACQKNGETHRLSLLATYQLRSIYRFQSVRFSLWKFVLRTFRLKERQPPPWSLRFCFIVGLQNLHAWVRCIVNVMQCMKFNV